MNEPGAAQNRLAFFDRDGVINEDRGYVGKVRDLQFIEPVFEVLQQVVNAGFLPVIVTNQSGIGRGYYSEAQFHALSRHMQQIYSHHHLPFIPVYYCPHHPTAGLKDYKVSCECRKPAPGMLYRAARELHGNLSQSILLGDSWRDIEAGAAAGLPAQCFINSSAPRAFELNHSRVFHATSVPAVPALIPKIIAASKSGSDA
ncbi:HAD family hydrolase [Salinimonas marina]|uniref:D,D-heptose 1,7-bisphosphate phosphatase n=1 Tax=Salinimonas marina TaxID=2785918 RepID=A0A7S9DUT1_9ALTE|nr:HAD family hydrolase [Salinimonas marina]QPG04317.1 HAD family hydrolase [Salinimonas marina]